MAEELINDRYVLERTLGKGGMGEVFLVRDLLHHGRRIALKRLHSRIMTPAIIQRFRREFRTLASLRHPNLAEVYEFSRVRETGQYFFSCEYVPGKDLLEACVGQNEKTIVRWISQLCLVLEYIHRYSFIHNDLKPNNVRLLENTEEIKLLDFGLVSVLQGEQEGEPWDLAGTPLYMAPEVILGEKPNILSDLYAVGMLLYRLLCPNLPFVRETSQRILRRHLEGNLPAPRSLNPSLSRKIEAVILRALAKEPINRFDSAKEFRSSLDDFLGKKESAEISPTITVSTASLIGREKLFRQALSFLAAEIPNFQEHILKEQTLLELPPPENSLERVPPVLTLCGAQGSGKSRFLREVQVYLQTRDVPVFTHTPHSSEGGFGLWRTICSQIQGDLSIPEDLLASFHTEENHREEVQGQSLLVMDRLISGLRSASKKFPFVLLIDDLHLADRLSIETIKHLVRLFGAYPEEWMFRMVVTLPETLPEDSELHKDLTALQTHKDLPHLYLSGLNEHDSRTFLLESLGISDCPAPFVSHLYHISGGNPLYLEEILRNLLLVPEFNLHELSKAHLDKIKLPQGLTQALEERLDVLRKGELLLLATLSLLQRGASAEFLSDCAAQSIQQVKGILWALREKSFILPIESGEWQLKTPAIAHILKERLPESEKRRIHGKIAQNLENQTIRNPEELAHHFLAAGDPPRAGMYFYEAACRNRKIGASTLAQTQLQQSLSLLTPNDPCLIQSRKELMEVEYILGNYDAVQKMTPSLIDEFITLGSVEEPVKLYRLLGKISQTRGELQEALHLYRKAMECLLTGKSGGRKKEFLQAELLALEANVFWLVGNHAEGKRRLEEALKLLPSSSKPSMKYEVGLVLNLAGVMERADGNFENAKRYWKRAREQFHYQQDLQGEAMVENNIGLLYSEQGDLAKAYKHYGKALEISLKNHDLKRLSLTYLQMGNLEAKEGKIQHACLHYQEALRSARALGDSSREAACLTNLAFAHYNLGQYAKALEEAKASLRVKEGLFNPLEHAHSLYAMAYIYHVIGQHALTKEFIQKARRLLTDQPPANLLLHLEILECLVFLDLEDENGVLGKLNELEGFSAPTKTDEEALDQLRVRVLLSLKKISQAKLILERWFPKGIWGNAEKKCDSRWLLLQCEFDIAGKHAKNLETLRPHIEQLLKQKDTFLSVDLCLEAEFFLSKIFEFQGDKENSDIHLRLAKRTAEEVARELPVDLAGYYWNRPILKKLKQAIELSKSGNNLKDHQAAKHAEKLERIFGIWSQLRSLRAKQKELFAFLLDEALLLTGAEQGFLLMRDSHGYLSVESARKQNKEAVRNPRAKISFTVLEESLRRKSPVSTIDALSDPKLNISQSVADLKLRSILCLPLLDQQKAIGVLYFDHTELRGAFNEETLQLAGLFAELVGFVIEQIKTTHMVQSKLEETSEELKSLKESISSHEEIYHYQYDYSKIVGKSKAMQQVFQLLERIIPTQTNVLIEGESGTGKELIAHAIHDSGNRKGKPLISVNCGALSPSLLESQLFGHVAGAFTGAESSKIGFFEAAHEGTFFLDEIGDMALELQGKLLRAIQQGEIVPVGASTPKKVDVRIIAATNRDLEKAVKEGTFREDLYYRLHVIGIKIPPLRERKEDLDLLIEHFLKQVHEKHPGKIKVLTPKVRRALLHYDWPGNVRELRYAIESMALFAEKDKISLKDLPPAIRKELSGGQNVFANLPLEKAKEEFLRRYLLQIYVETQGNIAELARRSGMHRVTIFRLVKKYLPGVVGKGRQTRFQGR